MRITTRGLLELLWSYTWDFRWIYGCLAMGTLLLASLLYFAEATPQVRSGLAAADTGAGSAGGGSVALSRRAPRQSKSAEDRIVRELQDVTVAVSQLNHDISSRIDAESEHLRALDSRVASLADDLRRIDESRRVTPVKALYYTCIAMLGLGDFGARTTVGRAVVVIAGFWGVLLFGLVTALLVAAVMKQYEEG